MSAIISIENLGKKYLIRHQTSRQSYIALRDVIADKTNNAARRLLNRFRSSGESHRTREEFWALRDVSFEVKQGDRVGIIGRNGAGKSTLLKILSRITGPTTGEVRIRARVASLLEVGTGFHPELSGRENIFLNGAILGMRKDEIKRKFDEIVDFAEIEKFLDTPVKHYSSGMYVRLAFGVAAHLEPEILIVDEVLAVGDIQFQRKCLEKMEDVGKRGRTVLFVSHNMGAVRSLCSEGIYLSNGEIKTQGEISDVVSKYLSDDFTNEAVVHYEVNPSNPIQFTKVSMLNGKQEPSTYLDMLQPFTVEIEYIVHEPVSGVMVGCNIFTSYGESLIATTDCDLDRSKFGKRERGVYKTSVTIPAALLNSGVYLLVIGISIPGKYIYDRQEVMNFELFDSGSFVVNGGGETRRRSLLLLGLGWNDK